ncbi:hypothetical protein CVT25_006955 [Psilocybe cyanescens]|uniref:Uncharacterized protein n=1 Tax=Psilocybe cyanescens TaxID=93625 RepID=A0A409VSK8_PSICY|nr:hypothetical protein CVT25_006955 [Psilocybe cyanescens]
MIFYEILAAILTTFRSWQALRIRVDLKSRENKLEYLVVQQGMMTARFILHLRKWEHKITMASTDGSILEPIEFQQPPPGSEQERSRISSIIDEFGRCPVRQARIERKSIPNDSEEV